MQAEEEQLGQCVYEKEVEIKNADGLHMRPAMQFVDIASKFDCDITVSNGPTSVDGKSIMQMSMLAATIGTKLRICAEGDDAKEAIDALTELIEVKKFDEPGPDEKNSKSESSH
ncbi:MAG: HPr family phosphocarrier protein [Sedimentisphaerales bacterium]|nr:HPr family phosphocarrier protein [Sedimentisphaerales bacterium]